MITGDLSAQCHYCTHYSSAIIVASYLVRMEPFSQTFLHLQVNFSPVWPGSITSHYCCYSARSATKTPINNASSLSNEAQHISEWHNFYKIQFRKIELTRWNELHCFWPCLGLCALLFFLSKTKLGCDFNMYANLLFCVTCVQNRISFLKNI